MFQRAGGGVATNLMDDDGNMISDTNEINQMIKNFFKEIHTASNQNKLTHQEKWEGLLPLDQEEVCRLMKSMAKKKAIAFDLIGDELFEIKEYKEPDKIMQLQRRINLLTKVWNQNTINDKHFKVFLESRLIPLNKWVPNCPKIGDIRPIVVTSQLIKFMERSFADRLRKYMID